MKIDSQHCLIRVAHLSLILICVFGVAVANFQDQSASSNRISTSNANATTGNASGPASGANGQAQNDNKTRANKVTTRPRVKTRKRAIAKEPAVSTISLWIISQPPNAKVSIDDEPRGETDAGGELEVKLLPGPHTIRVSRNGYITSGGEIDVVATQEAREVEFVLPLALTTVNIVTDPPEAEVYLDDIYKGASNANGLLVIERVNPGQPHTLRVRKDCYLQQSPPVTSYNGQISVKLLRDCIKLKVMTDPPEAEVYLDDVHKGTSTIGGLLLIEQVNPNQPHRLRGRKAGYQEQLISVSPNSSEVSLKLPPDPLVVLLKRIKQDLIQGNLVDAFQAYSRLTADAPDHQEIPRLLESILASLQSRSTQMLKQVGPFGLSIDVKDAQEMSRLYAQARTWRAGDEGLDVLARYWGIKFMLAKADESRSASEKENLRRTAQSALGDLSERSLRNMYLLMDVGWAWLRFNDNSTAQKYFNAAQELKADWAYPHFALGVMEMQAAEREVKKKSRLAMYEESIDSFTKAISLKHDFSRAYALRSISYAILKRYEDAAASGLQAIALDTKSAYAHFALGFAYFQKGKSAYRKSREEFNRALALDGVELDDVTKRSIQEWLAQIKKAIK